LSAKAGRRKPKPSSEPDRNLDVPGLAARMTAARLLGAIVDRSTLLDGLTDAQNGHPQFLALEVRDRALVRAILASALRFRRTIDAALSERLERPLPPNASALNHVLHVALAQILFLDIPDSAAVDLAVGNAGRDPRTRRFAGLVNAVLRGIAREREEVLPRLLKTVTEGPDWLVEALRASYGEDRTRAILAAHRVEPAVDFTVREDAEGWAERLGGIVLPTGSVRVSRPEGPIAELPGYAEGAWWIQDTAAALPARLMGPIAGRRVADLCAAPGGKTAQLALAGARVTAVELSANRARRLAGNLERLKLEVEIAVTDVGSFEPAEPFDAVLLDAPCSSTGTIRRHPDVAWTKTAEDVTKLAAVQSELLGHAPRLVRPGGTLVFSNCSLMAEEGEDLVRAFLAGRDDFERWPFEPDEVPGIAAFVNARGELRTTPDAMVQALPALSGMDGFFAVRLRRRAG
jgi:16S rRNA (cytosine967-C5)-methyltransferase